ncbi:fluoride efflux transporter CrcB [Hyphomicrobium facile]|uniref:Fluoride-specific ion channel FluC n=1 Tax=Hyphomicrobium facile TaxID=51670 RepID=A0A1I7NI57_9HYPH|nr:fluoride efflux transporter CrcB [Hyphomicrobium facile]SFV34334.1 camphor resistance protein CrcB [Hyphomicrobium facile]
MTALDVMWVGLGGGIGSLLRWWVGHVTGRVYHGSFPLGTFLINITGAFIIGYLSELFSVDWRDRYGAALNSGVLTGFLGGYTTFSSMELDAAKLNGSKGAGYATYYLVLSTIIGLIAAWCGFALARLQG